MSVGLAMTVRDGGRTIDDALASVAAQTRPPDRIVVVDDGSTDDTAARLDAWRERLDIEVLTPLGSGIAAGRTRAVAALDTDLVLGLDADDTWDPDHLERLLAAHRGGITAPLARRILPGGRSSGLVAVPPARGSQIETVLVMNWVFAGALFERSAWVDAGEGYRFDGCEDWDLWLRLLRAGATVATLDRPTVSYSVGADSVSADDRTLPMEIRVLETFVAETTDERLRSVAARSLRHRHARTALRASYTLTEAGRPWAARRSAVVATATGPRNVALRGAAMAVAPQAALHRRRDLRRR